MNMASGYRADNPQGMYVKNRPRRRQGNRPVKGMKNVKTFTILKKAGKTAVLLVAPETAGCRKTWEVLRDTYPASRGAWER